MDLLPMALQASTILTIHLVREEILMEMDSQETESKLREDYHKTTDICIKRASFNYLTAFPNSKDSTCPFGFRKCGSEEEKEGIFCTENDQACPILSINLTWMNASSKSEVPCKVKNSASTGCLILERDKTGFL